MLRRLATFALTLSLATTTLVSSAAAGFAQPPGAGAPRADLRLDDTDTRPRIAPAVRARLRTLLASRRAKNVAAFRLYAGRGVYPHNFTTAGPLNVWIDRDGHMCAAATMIFSSGAKTLVRKVGKTQNNIRLTDVTKGPLMDWMLTSGLTQAEIAAIQEPMMGPRVPQEPAPGSREWLTREDQRLSARYTVVLGELAAQRDASLDAAIDTLATRPDLVASLLTR